MRSTEIFDALRVFDSLCVCSLPSATNAYNEMVAPVVKLTELFMGDRSLVINDNLLLPVRTVLPGDGLIAVVDMVLGVDNDS